MTSQAIRGNDTVLKEVKSIFRDIEITLSEKFSKLPLDDSRLEILEKELVGFKRLLALEMQTISKLVAKMEAIYEHVQPDVLAELRSSVEHMKGFEQRCASHVEYVCDLGRHMMKLETEVFSNLDSRIDDLREDLGGTEEGISSWAEKQEHAIDVSRARELSMAQRIDVLEEQNARLSRLLTSRGLAVARLTRKPYPDDWEKL